MDWLSHNKIPLGLWIKNLVDLLNQHAQGFFNLVSLVLGTAVNSVTAALLWLPSLVVIALVAALALLVHRSWRLALLVVIGLLLIINLGYWKETMQTLSLVLWAATFSMLVGVPVGIAAAHRPRLYAVLRPVLDLMQTIPTFVYLIPTLILFGLGVVPGLISTVVFAIPAPIRLTHLGISTAPVPLREAVEAFGATRRQLLAKVELPHALPTIMAGVTQCIMLSLSMVVVAALGGAEGRGKPVVRALNSVNVATGFEAGLAIVVLAILLDRVCRRPEPWRA